jgi:hypothetical protein
LPLRLIFTILWHDLSVFSIANMTSIPQTQPTSRLRDAVHDQLWQCIDVRLERGDSLVRARDFQVALEADYAAITGEPVSRSVRRRLANAVVTCNRENPERYVAAGVQNSARTAFLSACTTLRWDPATISMSGPMAIARFKSHDRVRELLREVGVKLSAIDADACVVHAVQVVSGVRDPLCHDPSKPVTPPAPVLTVVQRDSGDTADAPMEVTETGDLSNEERRRGALIGRVEAITGGVTRRGHRLLMRSPDSSGKHVLAQRHPDSGQLEPVLRHGAGALQTVTRGIDGVWRED